MTPQLTRYLSQVRVQEFMDATQDIRFGELPVWSARVANKNATDGEIMAKVENYADAADLILDGGRAVAGQPNKIKFVTTNLVNIKKGRHMNQDQINLLLSLASGNANRGSEVTFDTYVRDTMTVLRLGVEMRRAWAVCAMVGETGAGYERLGVKLSGIDWGAPSDLKVTLAGGRIWDQTTTADGIADIIDLAKVARTKYGKVYNRVTFSTHAFMELLNQDTTKSRAQLRFTQTLTASNFPLMTEAEQKSLIGSILEMQVEIDDAMFREESEDGTYVEGRYMPENYVILSSTQDDGNTMVSDFGNAIVTESVVGQLIEGSIGGFPGGQAYGPIAYATGEINPPQFTFWSVARGFPRKHRDTAYARIAT